MKNTKDAIRYAIETTGVSPDEMFSLIESSKDYDGDDYNRWLASKVIEIAEKDGVGYSQLLVKKFNIIQDMINTKELVMKPKWVNWLKTCSSDECYSIDFAEIGTPLSEDIDWFNGIDYDAENSFFLAEEIPEIYERVIEKAPVNIIATLSDTGIKKNSELYADSTQRGVVCKNVGSLFLYRMCRILEAFSIEDNFTLRLFTDVDFLLNKENESIWKYFLQYFNYKGYVVQSSELYEGALGSKRFAFIECTPRTTSSVADCIMLPNAELRDDDLVVSESYRYTRSTINLERYLIDNTVGSKEMLPKEEISGLSGGTVSNIGEGALGYLNLSSSQGVWLSTYPSGELNRSIPITRDNLDDVIFYYSISTALKMYGINENIGLPLTGDDKYNSLVCNCIPLFLYGTNTRFRGYTENSAFDLESSDLVEELLKRGEVYYSFEAKELIDLCNGYSKFLINNSSDIRCLCFNDIRTDSEHAQFNSMYLSKIKNLCDYLRGSYKEVS